ncbi:LLM class flavin-dependent oxidoreductase [Actinomycetospora straminea]|uniref:Luciferase-like domain-containing protein n=1 Tax=Actinomycetospora straminea TaxID=663607 RepID=A0ABP9EK08_9PSEU|nr:LLM class flavin-dependent oxidoreductase [Actinomycetospora straminea]MDD7933300.1 LLM class flavin-dependent oxidoreductase [Actinomycetospora straminea]
MRLGATLTHLSAAPPYATARWARRLVEAGFASLWTPEVVARGPFVPDPFVTLAVAATAIADVELGTATVQVPLHHPVELAHRVLSLAAVAGDRLVLGVSPGSTRADYAALDRDHAGRFAAFGRDVARLRVLLAHGRDDDAALDPAGVPGLRLLLGSWGANVERAAREFDGWLAADHRRSADEIVAALGRFRAAGGGRAIVCAVRLSCPEDLAPARERLARYAEAGFDDAVVAIEPGGPEPEDVRALVP